LFNVLLPRSDGIAVMVLAITSCGTGFGLALDLSKLAKINLSRQGKKYIKETAVMDVLNGTKIEGPQAGPLFQSRSAVHIPSHLPSLPTTWLTILVQVQAEVHEKA
jgi:hypothetical protein